MSRCATTRTLGLAGVSYDGVLICPPPFLGDPAPGWYKSCFYRA